MDKEIPIVKTQKFTFKSTEQNCNFGNFKQTIEWRHERDVLCPTCSKIK